MANYTLDELNAKILAEPGNAEWYAKRGYLLNDLVRYDEAIVDYSKAIALKPDYALAYNNRGVSYNGLGQYSNAIADYDQAIALKPDLALAYNNRGITYYALKQYDSAIANYNMAIALKPDIVQAYGNRGNAYYALKQYDNAIADYNMAIALKPDYVFAYNGRGNAYNELKLYDNAIADYDMAIALKPDYADVYNNRGIVLKNLEQYDNAIADYDQAIALKPDLAIAYNSRGATYHLQQQYDNAIADYNQAIALKSDYAIAYSNRSLTYAKLGNTDQAAADRAKYEELTAAAQNPPAPAPEVEAIPPEERARLRRAKQLMKKIEDAKMEDRVKRQKATLNKFLREADFPEAPPNGLWVLRRWNSYTPIMAGGSRVSKGGGYFIKTEDCGVVIDPGFNFIDNFSAEGFLFRDIDHIFITHAHNDHTADLESLLTLLHERNDIPELEPATKTPASPRDGLLMDPLPKKRVALYMTMSTFKKYGPMLDLYAKTNYDLHIIEANKEVRLTDPNHGGKADYAKSIRVTPIPAKHDDQFSDQNAVGFMVQDEATRFALVYTGDTGYSAKMDAAYKQLAKGLKDWNVCLLAHLGGFKWYEQEYVDYNKSIAGNEKAFYKNHLGRLGLALLVDALKPKLCVISEFGEEFVKERIKLAGIFKDAYPNATFLAGDIGLCVKTDFTVRVITDAEDLTRKGFVPPDRVRMVDRKADASLHYYDSQLVSDGLTTEREINDTLIENYFAFLRR